jgi:hypothetical protein
VALVFSELSRFETSLKHWLGRYHSLARHYRPASATKVAPQPRETRFRSKRWAPTPLTEFFLQVGDVLEGVVRLIGGILLLLGGLLHLVGGIPPLPDGDLVLAEDIQKLTEGVLLFPGKIIRR